MSHYTRRVTPLGITNPLSTAVFNSMKTAQATQYAFISFCPWRIAARYIVVLRTKPYNSFPNQKSVDSHHNSKSSFVCTNCFSTICKPIWISDPEILVYWTYQEWEDLVRLPFGVTPRLSFTSITQICILSPLHSVTHVSYRLLTFERGIPYILSLMKSTGRKRICLLWCTKCIYSNWSQKPRQ